jgi:hypothetical protein
MGSEFTPPVVVLAGLAFGAGLWIAVGWLVSRVTGWAELARLYPGDRRPFRGQWIRWQSLQLRGFGGYNNAVRVGAGEEGLQIEMLWAFRIGHYPVFVPWSEVRGAEAGRRFFVPFVKLKLLRAPDIPLVIPARLAQRIEQRVGRRWPAVAPNR